ncbi:MAG: hypothetical protein QHH06_14760 [Clostridiales bacterium]|nr:hypothetical protein [Eubacteriales bacterium]MDH7567701.1 hypothetical protein [Clostridiales bacterium]
MFTVAIFLPVSLVFTKFLWIARITSHIESKSSVFFSYISMYRYELLTLAVLVLLLGLMFIYINKSILTPSG